MTLAEYLVLGNVMYCGNISTNSKHVQKDEKIIDEMFCVVGPCNLN